MDEEGLEEDEVADEVHHREDVGPQAAGKQLDSCVFYRWTTTLSAFERLIVAFAMIFQNDTNRCNSLYDISMYFFNCFGW